MPDVRPKPYSLVGEPNVEMVAKIDEMFESLFTDLEANAGGTHDLLSSLHPDTEPDDAVRGDIIVAQGTNPVWTRVGIGASGYFLKSDGVDAAWGQVTESDIVDGSLLARVADAETITGSWTFQTGTVKFNNGLQIAIGTNLTSINGANTTTLIGMVSANTAIRIGNTVGGVGNAQINFFTNTAQRLQLTASVFTSTLPFQGPTGSAAVPSFSHSTDTNTGLYFDGADSLLFTTGGTLRLTLNTTELIAAVALRSATVRGSASASGTLTLQSTSHATKGGVLVSSDWLEFDEITAPGSPAANKGRLYAADLGGVTALYFKDSAGTATNLLAGSPVTQTTTLTGTQNNFDLGTKNTYLRCNNASALVLSGFTVAGAAPASGDTVIIDNVGTSTVQVTDEAAGSTAANRVTCVSASGQIVGAGGRMHAVYDGTSSRWRLALIDPGAFIPVTYAAGNFTGQNLMTWTVESGDQVTYQYVQQGRRLHIQILIGTSTLGGTPSGTVLVTLPTQFTVSGSIQVGVLGRMYDNSAWTTALYYILPSSSTTQFFVGNMAGVNLTLATNVFDIDGSLIIEVD
jgi:hypothetical protein